MSKGKIEVSAKFYYGMVYLRASPGRTLNAQSYYLTALGLAMEWKRSSEHFQNKLLECLTMPAMPLFDFKLDKFKSKKRQCIPILG